MNHTKLFKPVRQMNPVHGFSGEKSSFQSFRQKPKPVKILTSPGFHGLWISKPGRNHLFCLFIQAIKSFIDFFCALVLVHIRIGIQQLFIKNNCVRFCYRQHHPNFQIHKNQASQSVSTKTTVSVQVAGLHPYLVGHPGILGFMVTQYQRRRTSATVKCQFRHRLFPFKIPAPDNFPINAIHRF